MPTEASKLPDASPFEETETEASLRRIAESGRALAEAQDAHDKNVLALAEAKDEAKKTRSLLARLTYELRESVAGETADMPLFPRAKETPGDKKPKPSPESPPHAGGFGDESRFMLMLIPGIPLTVAQQLADRGIHTLGDLAAFTNGGGLFTDFKGVGPESAEKALAALDAFWETRRRGGKPADAA